MVDIIESYRSYEPHSGVAASVRDLLRRTPARYTNGLSAVVFTDSASVTKARTRRVRGRKYRSCDCLGFYHGARHGQGATVELLIDNILRSVPAWAVKLAIVRDVLLSEPPYHEIGHHLDEVIGSHSRTGEMAAKTGPGE